MKKKSTIFLLLLMVICFFLLGCKGVDNPSPVDGHADKWTGEFTGNITGKLEFVIWDSSDEGGVRKLNGKIKAEGRLTKVESHEGVVEGLLKGEIKEGVFTATIRGRAQSHTTFETVSLTGSMSGIIGEIQGFGTWSMTLDDIIGKLSGEWNAQKK